MAHDHHGYANIEAAEVVTYIKEEKMYLRIVIVFFVVVAAMMMLLSNVRREGPRLSKVLTYIATFILLYMAWMVMGI